MYDAADIVERLERRFKLGANPTLRKALYQRLGDLCEQVGDAAYYIISSTAADAASADDPAKFFCKIVLRRLIERGILKAPDL